MERYCLDLVNSTWLASPISCCFSRRLQDQPEKPESAAPGISTSLHSASLGSVWLIGQ